MSHERKIVFLISIMIILTTYISGLTRAIKDILLVSFLGAEILNALKLYFTLPVSIVIMLTYSKLVEQYKSFTIYHTFNFFFILFFTIFGLFLYPNSKILHFEFESEGMINFINNWPIVNYIVVIIKHWTYSLFYIVCELWSNVMMIIVFWQMMNKITNVRRANTLYPFLILISQIGAAASGITINYCSNIGADYGWDYTLNYIISLIILFSFLISFNMFYLSRFVDLSPEMNSNRKKADKNQKDLSASIIGNLKSIMSSRYTILIMILVICYSFSYSLVSTLWKSIVISYLPDPVAYGRFMGQVQSISAIVSVLFMILSTYLIKFVSWRSVSIITPLITCASALIFFAYILYYNRLIDEDYEISGMDVLSVAIVIGAIQNILSRSCSAFFYPTKEIVFIPIAEPNRSIAKGMEMVASRFGRAGGALVQWIMLSAIAGSSLLELAPNIMIIFIIIIVIWVFSIVSLSVEFNNKIR